MKITASVTKSSHEHCGQYYLHLSIFSYTYTLLFCWKMKSCCDCCAVFLSKLDHRPLLNDYETNLV